MSATNINTWYDENGDWHVEAAIAVEKDIVENLDMKDLNKYLQYKFNNLLIESMFSNVAFMEKLVKDAKEE